MTTRENILQYVKLRQKKENVAPIYEIMMVENADQELIYKTNKRSGFPDTGATDTVGFYYNLDDAIQAVTENRCDIRETVYNAAFILCRFPGLYDVVTRDMRLYFLWDEEGGGYTLTEEPKIFSHIAY